MQIAIDCSPLESGHRVRGVGFYVNHLKDTLTSEFPKHSYTCFTGTRVPFSAEVVHYPYFDPYFLTLPMRKPKHTVVTVHDLIPIKFPAYFPAGVKGKLRWLLQRWSLSGADAVITDSEASKADIIRYTNVASENIHVIYLAASKSFTVMHIKNLQQNITQRYSLPNKFILYVGDVTWNKNIPNLVRAIKQLQIPLVMVGKALVQKEIDRSNPWNNDLVTVQDEIKNDPLFYRLGFVPTEDLVVLYNTAILSVMPSLYEGFGLPVLEAMQSGCPVVTTKAGSLPEVAGDAAFYVNPEDVESIVAGIQQVYHNSRLREDLKKKGLMQAEKFSWKKTAQETIDVYEKICKEDTL